MNPLVSILIPAYNSEKWIRATIQSALDQTWQNKEVIVVDDGSTDNTLRIAREFESRKVKVFSQPNRGECGARNQAYWLSQGDFIQWLDADDLLAPDKIEVQLAGADADPGSRILHSSAWGRFFYRIKNAAFSADPLWQDLSPVDWLLLHIGDGHMMYPAPWLISRGLSELAGPWDERLSKNGDGEYFCRVVAASELVKFHPQAKSYYRRAEFSGASFSRSRKTFEALNLSYNLSVDHLLGCEDSEKTRKACARLLHRFISWSCPGESDIVRANQDRILDLGGDITPPRKSRIAMVLQECFGPAAPAWVGLRIWTFKLAVRKNWDRLQAVVHRDGV